MQSFRPQCQVQKRIKFCLGLYLYTSSMRQVWFRPNFIGHSSDRQTVRRMRRCSHARCFIRRGKRGGGWKKKDPEFSYRAGTGNRNVYSNLHRNSPVSHIGRVCFNKVQILFLRFFFTLTHFIFLMCSVPRNDLFISAIPSLSFSYVAARFLELFVSAVTYAKCIVAIKLSMNF